VEQKPPHNQYDLTFKRIFSFKEVFVNFLKSTIKRPWVDKIDLQSLEFVDRSFVKDEFVEKEADVIYRAKIEDTDIYFYVLLEAQSTTDKTMPRRLFEYMNLIWQRHIEETKDDLLPPIVPIVLYNGRSNWNVPTLIFKGWEIFKDDMFNYFLVDVNNIDDETLKNRLDLLSVILYLDRSRKTAKEFIEKLKEVTEYISCLPTEQVKVFAMWLLRVIRPQMMEEVQGEIDELLKRIEQEGVADVGDFVFNVQRLMQEYYKEAEEKGKEKGYEEGKLEGKLEGELEATIRIARNMILAGAEDSFISKVTGLDIEKIKELRQNMTDKEFEQF